MTLATACFDTDSSVAEDSSNKFWCRKPQSDDSAKNDDQDSENDSWPSSASSDSISINFNHDTSTNDAPDLNAPSRKSSNNFFFQPMNNYPGDGSSSSSAPIAIDVRRSFTNPSSSRRRQTKLLLVALIESFCAIYGDHPENNRRIFFLICQTLNSMGFVDKEFVDEMASVRSSFQRAFQRLFWTALETIRSEDFQLAGGHKLITPTAWNEKDTRSSVDEFESIVEDTFSSVPSQFQQIPNMGFDLSVDNSRYLSDFVEMSLLGKGGFASAWRARNKLDDIEYAIKKVWLGNDICEDGGNPYDKIFREIKSLARLEHKNVIRYYSSWLEWRQGRKSDDLDTDHLSENDEWTNHSDVSKKSSASIFEGIDPTFEDSGEFGYMPEASSTEISGGIDFVSDNSSSDVIDGKQSSSTETEKPPPVISILKLGKSAECRRDNHCTFAMPEDCPLANQSSDSDSGHITSPMSPPNSQPQVSSIPIVKRERKISHGRHGSFDYFAKPVRSHTPVGGWTLFIQMQLCPATLQDYIRYRNRHYTETGCCIDEEDCRKNIEIFSQILDGVAYIHEKGLIHRDLKPGNIFLGESSERSRHRRSQSWSHHRTSKDDSSISSSSDSTSSADWFKRHLLEGDWVPKIGDFGLVAHMTGTDGEAMVSASSPLSDSVSEFGSSFGTAGQNLREMAHSIGSFKGGSSFKSTSSFKSDGYSPASRRPSRPKYHTSRTSPVGTITYASPEQLANPPLAYDQKVDIYSLGIIFFELYQPFATGMERAASLRDLKKGVLPDNFVKKFPKESALILWMMSEDAAQRPTAQQLIEFEMFAIPPDMYSSLHIQLQDKTKALDQKDSEVARLRAAMDEKQRECDEMRIKIKKMEDALKKMEMSHMVPSDPPTPRHSHAGDSPSDIDHVQRFSHWRNGSANDTPSQVFDKITLIID
jgi:translation initiation factor 2-alpha kinase 1